MDDDLDSFQQPAWVGIMVDFMGDKKKKKKKLTVYMCEHVQA